MSVPTLTPIENQTAFNGRALAVSVYSAPAAAGIAALPGAAATLGAGLGLTAAGLTASSLLIAGLNGGARDLWAPLTGKSATFFPNNPSKFVFASGNQTPTPSSTEHRSWYGPGETRWRSWKEANGKLYVRVRAFNAAGLTAALVTAANSYFASAAAETGSAVGSGLGGSPLLQAGGTFFNGVGENIPPPGSLIQFGQRTIDGALNLWDSVTTDPAPPPPAYVPPPVETQTAAPASPLIPLGLLALAAFFL